jgi:hypothetical protein
MARDYDGELTELEKQRKANNDKIHEDGLSERNRLEGAIKDYPEHESLYREEINSSQKREDDLIASNNKTSFAKADEIRADEFKEKHEAALDIVDPPAGGSVNTSQTYTASATLGDPTITQSQSLSTPNNLNTEKETPNLPPERAPGSTQATVLSGVEKGLAGIEKAEHISDLVTPMTILAVAGAAIAKDAIQKHLGGVDKLADATPNTGTAEIQNGMLANINDAPPEASKVATMHMEGGSPAQASNVDIIVPPPPPPPPPPPANDNVKQI